MELKSKMSLDISGITSNLKKVANQTNNLGRSMSSAFTNARTSLEALNNTLKKDIGDFGFSANAKAHAETIGKQLTTSFANLAVSAKDSVGKVKNAVTDLYGAFRQDTIENGFFRTLATHAEYAFDKIKSSVSEFYTSTLSTLRSRTSAAFTAIKSSMNIDAVTTKLKSQLLGIAAGIKTAFVNGGAHVQQFASAAIKPLVGVLDSVQRRVDKFIAKLSSGMYLGNNAVKELTENVKKAGIQFKDVARIVQGIVISRIFYSGLQSIQNATTAVWDFAKALEYSRLVYTNFFGNVGIANEFLDVLKQFAVQTRFSYNELNTAAQQLVAYGFQAKNLMFLLQGVSAAASISGDPAKIESISRALGQIYTKGRLMSEEMRQLAEAGIPAYDILQEKLGLTYKQMQKLGDLQIPAATAINALVLGIQERFGGLLDYTNMTMAGMASNIADIGLQMAEGIFKPFIQRARWALGTLMTVMSEINEVFQSSGLGGVFEKIFPPEIQNTIRNIIAGFYSLGNSLKIVVQAIFNIINAVGPTFLTWLNIVVTIVSSIVRVLASFAYMLTSNATALSMLTKFLIIASAAWILFKVRALAALASGAIIKGLSAISKGIAGISNALVSLAQHPALLIFITLTGLVLILTGTLDKARSSLNNFLSSMNGNLSGTILQPKTVDKATGSLEDFNKMLDGTGKGMDDLTKKSKKAKKAADSLSFDEIFKVNIDEGTDDGILSQWEELLNNISAGNADFSDVFDDIEFDDFGKAFIDKLVEEFKTNLKEFGKKLKAGFDTVEFNNMLVASLAAILALAALGFNPVGIFAAFGLILVGVFWDDILNAFGLDWKVDLKTALMGALVAALALAALGFTPAGIFAAFAALIIGAFWDDIRDAFGLDWNFDLGAVAMAAIIAAVAIATLGFTPAGVFVALAALVVSGFWDDIAETFGVKDPTISLGEVVLAAIGAAIAKTSFVGKKGIWVTIAVVLVASFWDEIAAQFGLTYDVGLDTIVNTAIIGASAIAVSGLKKGLFVTLAAAIVLGFKDDLAEAFGEDEVNEFIATTIATSVATGANAITKGGKFSGIFLSVAVALVNELIKELGKEFGKSAEKIGASVSSATAAAIVAGLTAALVGVPVALAVPIAAVVTGLFEMFKDEIEDFLYSEGFQASFALLVAGGIGFAIAGVPGALLGVLGGAAYDIVVMFGDEIMAEIKEQFAGFAERFKSNVDFIGEFFKVGAYMVEGIFKGISSILATPASILDKYVFDPIINGIKDLFGIHSPATTMEPIGAFIIEGIWVGISGAMKDFLSNIGEKVADVAGAFKEWFDGVKTKVDTWSSDTWTTVSTWTKDTATNFITWCTDRKNDFETWRSSVTEKIGTWATETGTTIGTWATEKASDIAGWADQTSSKIGTWIADKKRDFTTWATDTGTSISNWVIGRKSDIKDWAEKTGTDISDWSTATGANIKSWVEENAERFTTWFTDKKNEFVDFATKVKADVKDWTDVTGVNISDWTTDASSNIGTFITDSLKAISGWAKDIAREVKSALASAWNKIDDLKNGAAEAVSGVWNSVTDSINDAIGNITGKGDTPVVSNPKPKVGHATGGIFNREHVANISEKNKEEAIIPLENDTAMQPFSDAVSNSIVQSLAPLIASLSGNNTNNSLQPLYVGTLIADERGLRELNKKMRIIDMTEADRRS